ncbi:hypothetical protein Tco_1060208 [Tanacetum coccineum]
MLLKLAFHIQNAEKRLHCNPAAAIHLTNKEYKEAKVDQIYQFSNHISSHMNKDHTKDTKLTVQHSTSFPFGSISVSVTNFYNTLGNPRGNKETDTVDTWVPGDSVNVYAVGHTSSNANASFSITIVPENADNIAEVECAINTASEKQCVHNHGDNVRSSSSSSCAASTAMIPAATLIIYVDHQLAQRDNRGNRVSQMDFQTPRTRQATKYSCMLIDKQVGFAYMLDFDSLGFNVKVYEISWIHSFLLASMESACGTWVRQKREGLKSVDSH